MINDYEYDDNIFPLAYLITIRSYGTWLHGDERLSIDRHGKNIYGAPRIAPNPKLENFMRRAMKQPARLFSETQRCCVEEAIIEVCEHRGYDLKALNIRTNHVHAVVAAESKPEPIINAFKSYATRKLRINKLVGKNEMLWARGKSRRYLWKPRHVALAIEYVLYGQDDVGLDFD